MCEKWPDFQVTIGTNVTNFNSKIKSIEKRMMQSLLYRKVWSIAIINDKRQTYLSENKLIFPEKIWELLRHWEN